jgi:hypothetical protein
LYLGENLASLELVEYLAVVASEVILISVFLTTEDLQIKGPPSSWTVFRVDYFKAINMIQSQN